MKEYFKCEVEKTIATVEKNRDEEDLTFCILSDSHYEPDGTWEDTAATIYKTLESVPVDAIIHLGDFTDGCDKKKNTASYVNKMLGVVADSFDDYGYPGHYDSNKLSFEKFVAHITDNLGTQVEGNKKITDTTDIMLDSVTNARDEVSRVSINEEGINMLNFQKWYNAIARMVTTLDEALDKVVNGMGRVGL